MSFLHLYYTIEILNQYGKHKNKPMKKLIISALLLGITGGGIYAREKVISHGYPITPVPFTSVKLTDSFWGQLYRQVVKLPFHWLLVNVKKLDVIKILKWLPTPVTAIK